jgi:hypothetical protein
MIVKLLANSPTGTNVNEATTIELASMLQTSSVGEIAPSGEEVIVHVVPLSLAAKLLPEIAIAFPTVADVGFSVILGMTVRFAAPRSPIVAFTMIV